MITPLVICLLLIVPLVVAAAVGQIAKIHGLTMLGGITGLSLAYFFFASGHFIRTEGMIEMLPAFVPMRKTLIMVTGVWEIGIAICLLISHTRRIAGIASIVTLIAFFPANIFAAMNEVGLGGHQWGAEYLLIRAPLQILLIGWSYVFAVRSGTKLQSRRSVN